MKHTRKIFFIVLRKGMMKKDEWLPTCMDKTRVLYFAGNRKNANDRPVGFESRKEAQKAIGRTKTYFKKYRPYDQYKIVAINIVIP